MRADQRAMNDLRKITIQTDILKYPEGSVLVTFGETIVLCTASVEESVPSFLKGTGKGWVTAEYSMLPRATDTRNRRDSSKGKINGRSSEIQRLIGRSLRSVVDLEALGENSIIIDCDVIQADGGTRTASITGGFVALKLAINHLLSIGALKEDPTKEYLAAISVGILANGEGVVDLNYQEDSQALVDMNLVMTESGRFVEIQGTGEEATFSFMELQTMLQLGGQAIAELITKQKNALKEDNVVPAKQANEYLANENDNEIVIATKNHGKAAEFKAIFAKKGYKVKTLLDYPEIGEIAETGSSFSENARIKAETIATLLQRTVIGDDSGLVVTALGGRPGIFSARFAGEPKNDAANNAKLLHELTDVPAEKRQAVFHCSLVAARPNKASLVVEGEVQGEILRIPRGNNGFGYDPLFYLANYKKSMAELSKEEKNKISHRAVALAKLGDEWDQWMQTEEEE